MIIQEPIKATIWFALDNYAFADAIFLSERLYAEVNTEENLYILGTAYFRSGKHNIAYSILTRNYYDPSKSPNCNYLLAKCCLHLGKIEEATHILLTPITDDMLIDRKFSKEEICAFYGELSSFVAQLLGQLFYKLEEHKIAAHYYAMSLKINPFLWSSYERLLQIDPRIDYEKLFNIDCFDLKYSCGSNPLINLFNSSSQSLANLIPNDNTNSTLLSNNKSNEDNTSHQNYFATPEIRKSTQQLLKNKIELSTPFAILKQSSCTTKVDVITPETDGNWHMMTCLAPTKNNQRNTRKYNSNNTTQSSQVLIETSNLCSNRILSNNTESTGHSFGVISLDRDSVNIIPNNGSNSTSVTNSKLNVPTTKISRTHKDSSDSQMLIDDPTTMVNNKNTTSILTRRSSRLNSDSRSIKENASNAAKNRARVQTPVKRCRRTIDFDKSSKLVKQNNENNSTNTPKVSDVTKTGVKAQRTSANGLIELIKKFAIAYKCLSEYRCLEAIELFKKLPAIHFNTGYVLSMIGRSYFEMGLYEEAINQFKLCRELEPYRLQGLEIYSTALWHLQRELELSCLSQELIQFDKFAPETWCVAGNCFSLQKDHEISIKFLKRAIQVDPTFSYAYTLLGHELISADDLDNAMSCFSNATRIDPRHYNAWCGIGLIYYKQEKYNHAFHNYKRALDISPFNPILMCHLAIVLHHQKQSKDAIQILNEASKLDPSNVLIKFHRASIRFSLEEYQQALDELEDLKKMVPRESMVYFLIGKIHKIRGDTHLAVANFSWAVHIDPKGSANQHKDFTEPNQISNDEIVVHPGQESSSELTSTPVTTPFTQRSTYITGPISGYSSIAINSQLINTDAVIEEFDEESEMELAREREEDEDEEPDDSMNMVTESNSSSTM